MQLVIKAGEVIASHSDTDTVALKAYGEGARLLPFAGSLADLARIGAAPEPGEPDLRAYAAPVLDEAGLIAYAASVRYEHEIGGITVGGEVVDTSVESQNRIANADAYLLRSGGTSIRFKAATGFVTMSAETLKAIALAVGAHVQALFEREGEVVAAIQGGTITSMDGVDTAFAA